MVCPSTSAPPADGLVISTSGGIVSTVNGSSSLPSGSPSPSVSGFLGSVPRAISSALDNPSLSASSSASLVPLPSVSAIHRAQADPDLHGVGEPVVIAVRVRRRFHDELQRGFPIVVRVVSDRLDQDRLVGDDTEERSGIEGDRLSRVERRDDEPVVIGQRRIDGGRRPDSGAARSRRAARSRLLRSLRRLHLTAPSSR